jgi:predicted  nucleic acid-binding Zn-ribbon protein
MVSSLTLVLLLLQKESTASVDSPVLKVVTQSESSVGSDVNLYYFPDALKIIRTLRPGESITELKESEGPDPSQVTKSSGTEPANKPTSAKEAEGTNPPPVTLEEALANHTRVLNSLATDKEELKALTDQLPSLETELEELESVAYDKDVEVKNATKKVTKLEADVAAETDATKKEELNTKLAAAQKLNEKATRAKERADDKVKAKKSEVKNVEDRIKELKGRIATFNQRVAASNANLLTARSKLRKEARANVESFAKERDAEPIFYLAACTQSQQTDPVKRVSFTAFKNARTLFLRGSRQDVDYVKELVSQLDRPTPQARLSLWNLELNVLGEQGRSALAKNLPKVSEALDTARAQTAALTSCFRKAVNDEVGRIQSLNLSRYQSIGNDIPIFPELYARYNYFEPEVARRLGFDSDKARLYGAYFYFTHWILPDPASTTTLGESLMIFVLGSSDSRARIWKNFNTAIADDQQLSASSDKGSQDIVSRLQKALGHTGIQNSGITAYQLEIVRALQLTALDRIIDKSSSIALLLKDFQTENASLYKGLLRKGISGIITPLDWSQNVLKPVSETTGSLSAQGLSASAAFMLPALLWLRSEFGIGIDFFDSIYREWKSSSLHKDATTIEAFSSQKFRYVFPTSQSNARVAAADEMLKTIMIAFEDDVHVAFVEPALAKVRQTFKQKGVSVGALERTSMLATNRFIGRVKTGASAQLDLAGEEKVLENAIGLANLVTTSQGQNIGGILSSLNQKNALKDMELYAINSGSEYKITPIFDPSGQAFSFQFDYVKTTNIVDPDGSASVLPRVDTHETNLKVQVSNLEIREVSQFNSTTKLGVPARTTGGIPILQDVPLLRDLPLIGWFSKRNGREAVSQTSFIFAQSAVYPTIGDIGSLLTGSFMVPPFSSAERTDSPSEKSKGKGKGKDKKEHSKGK